MNRILLTAALLAVPAIAAAQSAPTAATYVMKAGAGDQYEIQSSKLVLQTTANPALKQFANMMVSDHQKSTADVKAAALKSRLAPKPPMLDAMGRKNIAALKASTGAARDKLYVTQQKTAHQNALALHQGYAASGSAPALKQVAATIAPTVQHHIEMLSSM
jgi:putative membrane protein